jgi:hypothetical protein
MCDQYERARHAAENDMALKLMQYKMQEEVSAMA